MPTIHIHSTDVGLIGNVVAILLSIDDNRLSFTIDHGGTPTTKRAERDPLHRPFVDARPTAADRAAHQAYYDARRELAEEAVIAVKCTTCKVPVGRPCQTGAGKPYRTFVHVERIERYRRLQASTEPTPVVE